MRNRETNSDAALAPASGGIESPGARGPLPFDVVHYYGAGVLLPEGRVALITDDEGAPQNAVDLFTVGR